MVFRPKTDQSWEYFGKNDPYFGVITRDVYKTDQLNQQTKKEFFASGESHVNWIFDIINHDLVAGFRPSRALDFGCGVGRLVIPLGRRCDSVVGVDVSESMLHTAALNIKEHGLTNVTFVKGDDKLSNLSGRFDFIHSFIVFQHIPQNRGVAILRRQIELLQDDGVGALHFTYGYASSASTGRRLLTFAEQKIPFVSALRSLLKGGRLNEPQMEMYQYDVNQLLRILQECGCHRWYPRFTETNVRGNAFYGVLLCFQKRATDVQAHG